MECDPHYVWAEINGPSAWIIHDRVEQALRPAGNKLEICVDRRRAGRCTREFLSRGSLTLVARGSKYTAVTYRARAKPFRLWRVGSASLHFRRQVLARRDS